jgi:hypothetical protein
MTVPDSAVRASPTISAPSGISVGVEQPLSSGNMRLGRSVSQPNDAPQIICGAHFDMEKTQ